MTKRTQRVLVCALLAESEDPLSARQIAVHLKVDVSRIRNVVFNLWSQKLLERGLFRQAREGDRQARTFYVYRLRAKGGPVEEWAPLYLVDTVADESRSERHRLSLVISACVRAGGWRNLAAAVLVMAIADWRCPAEAACKVACSTVEADEDRRFESVKEEVVAFWDSGLGILLREELGFADLRLEEIAETAALQQRPARIGSVGELG